jgi:hypothetical protein
MNSAVVWVLSFTIIGTTPIHGSIGKFKSKAECEQALEQRKQAAKNEKKQLAGSCSAVSK